MMEGRDSSAPRHPRIDQRSLVLWAGHRAGLDVYDLDRDVTGALALPLRRAVVQGALIARAREEEMGIVLPGQAWMNQLPPDARAGGFAALPFAQPGAIDVEGQRMSPGALADYAESFLDAQLAAGATLVTTPAHVFEQELGHGREQDLALAQASIAAWNERQAWRPPPQHPDDPPRELHACIAVRGAHLGAEAASAAAGPGADAAARLVDLYAELDVSGYWVVVFDASDSGAESAGLAELALGLQAASGRPVTVSGVASLHVALLASGVAATCTGVDGMRPSFPPRAIDGDEVVGIGVPVFHPAILGSVPLGPEHDETRTWLFAAHPCRCGEHTPYEPPRGRRQTVHHNSWCLAAEARDATRLLPLLDERRLAGRIRRATAIRARLDLPALEPGWSAVASAAHALRAGAEPGVAEAVGLDG
jgi:hypothetical protein